MQRTLLFAICFGPVAAACVGQVAGDPSLGPPVEPPFIDDDNDPTTPPVPNPNFDPDAGGSQVSAAPVPGRTALRRLTQTEYLRSLAKLTGVSSSGYAANLTKDGTLNGFDNQAAALSVTFENLSTYQRTAEDIAARAVGTTRTLQGLFPTCTPLATGCLDAAVRALGRRVYRRPLDNDEFLAVRDAAYSSPGVLAADAPRAIVESLLLSPQFLYRSEIGVPAAGRPGLLRLTAHEIASALSFTLWQETPDTALLDAAEAGQLADAAAIEGRARAMLTDARATSAVESFATQYLRVPKMQEVSIPSNVAGFDATLRAAAIEEIRLLARDYFLGAASVMDVFRSPYTYVNDRLAAVYGFPKTGSTAHRRVDVPAGSERQGLFGTSGFFLATSHGDTPSVIYQGMFVRGQMLCDEISGPPAALRDQIANDPNAGNSEARLNNPSCAGCHRQLDLIGKGLSAYNVFGQKLANVPADATRGAIEGYPNPEFSGPAELGAKVIATGRVPHCLSQNLLTWLAGRGVETGDQPTVAYLASALERSQNRFVESLPAYFASEAFLIRKAVSP